MVMFPLLKNTFLQFKNFLFNLDKGLYFPIFLGLSTVLVCLVGGLINAYIFAVVTSLLHTILLKFFPYVKDSDYYRYRFLKERFYQENLVIKPFFRPTTITFSYIFLVLGYYLSFFCDVEEMFIYLFPFYGIPVGIIMPTVTVDIINIVSRPRLPKSIYNYHPVFQRRFGPVTDVLINKIMPVCVQVGKGLFAGYSGLALSTKALNGAASIDPIRNYACNLYHGFPSDHQWTEGSLIGWSMYKKTQAFSQLPYEEGVKVFRANEAKFYNATFGSLKPSLVRSLSK